MNVMRYCAIAALAWSSPAGASVVVTQIQSRAYPSLWLLNTGIQQGMAHQQVIDEHDVSAVPVFDASTLAGVGLRTKV